MEDAFQGQSTEIQLAVTEVVKDNIRVQEELARLCGQPLVKVKEDMKRDFYLTAAEAAAYGVIDHVLMPPQVCMYVCIIVDSLVGMLACLVCLRIFSVLLVFMRVGETNIV